MWGASTHRDDARFDDPRVFRIEPTPNPQLFIGIGEHFCLGANLARRSLRIITRSSWRRSAIDDIGLAGASRRLRSNLINGIEELQITYRPA